MKFFNRQGWGRTLLLAAALAVVGLLGCMITTSGPDDNGGNTTGATGHTHTWGDWAVTTPATCDAQGVEIRTCTQDASHIEARVIAQLTGTACNTGGGDHVHTWGDWTVMIPATCNAQGAETRTCTQDANHKEARVIAQLTWAACDAGGDHVHTWGDWIVLAQATCDVPGVEMRRCTQNPNHVDSRQTAQLSGAACGNSGGGGDHVHTWGNWVVTAPATCNAQGVETRTCTLDASHKETRAIVQLTGAACNTGGGDHVHAWGAWVVLSPATCTAQGLETRTCTLDGSHKEIRTIDELTGAACNTSGGGDHVHTWGSWVVTTPATCNAQGVETRTCTQDASHKETSVIAQLNGVACNIGNNTCGKDGTANSCKTVTIGGQTWMAENLNMDTFDSWCYDDNPSNCAKYGRLYTNVAAKEDACGSIPGWHLPSFDEWRSMVITAGGVDGTGTVARKLKSNSGWNSPQGQNGNGKDTYGFSALPGGSRSSSGSFYNVGNVGIWWVNGNWTMAGYGYVSMSSGADDVNTWYTGGDEGLSVRCVKDE